MRNFFKTVLASAIGSFLGLLAILILAGAGVGGLLIYAIVTASSEPEPTVRDKSILAFDLSTAIVDGPAGSGSGVTFEGSAFGGSRTLSLRAVVESIEAAAEDDRIVGLYLYGGTQSGFATLEELRQALATFQASEKPILAYGNLFWDERDYYLASMADEIFMNPSGMLEVNGLSTQTQFLAGAFDQYGIGVQVLRAGRYKSAVEPFILDEYSPEEREQTEALLQDLWQDFLAVAGENRDRTPAQLQALADSGGVLLAEEAIDAGLVDQLASFDQVLSELQELTEESDDNEDSFRQVDLAAYTRVQARQSQGRSEGKVAIVYANGSIRGGESTPGRIGAEDLSNLLREIRLDDDIDAVVLRINSPGGGAAASEVISEAAALLREEKPLMVSMGNLAASGGYMLAAQGDRIFASANSLTGSIGVFGLLINFQEVANDNGITWDGVKTAEFADMGTSSRPMTSAELALQQQITDRLYQRFLTIVAESREMETTEVDNVAQGRVWSGRRAAEVGLVDEVGGLQAAIAAAAAAADLETWELSEYPRAKTLEDQIVETLFGEVSSRWRSEPTLPPEIQQLRQGLEELNTLDDPRHMYMRLPFTTEFDN